MKTKIQLFVVMAVLLFGCRYVISNTLGRPTWSKQKVFQLGHAMGMTAEYMVTLYCRNQVDTKHPNLDKLKRDHQIDACSAEVDESDRVKEVVQAMLPQDSSYEAEWTE